MAWAPRLTYLDDVFGVTNTKQAATGFYHMELDEDAKAEGLTAGQFEERLKENEDPRWAIYQISRRITSNLRTIRAQITRQREGARATDFTPPPGWTPWEGVRVEYGDIGDIFGAAGVGDIKKGSGSLMNLAVVKISKP